MRHGQSAMESPAGVVTHCDYLSGYCALDNGKLLHWEPKLDASCPYVPWRDLDGTQLNVTWLSDDGNFALTFTKPTITTTCNATELVVSDQGVVVRRAYLPPPKRNQPRRRGRRSWATTETVAGQIQALEEKLQRALQHNFQHMYSTACSRSRDLYTVVQALMTASPTFAARALLNNTNLIAHSSGDMLQVLPCGVIPHDAYTILPMNETCFRALPLLLELKQKTKIAYMDTSTNIISFLKPTTYPCKNFAPFPIHLRDGYYLYFRNGTTQKVDADNFLELFHAETKSPVNLFTTIFHEISMYDWDEIDQHISLNDVIGQLQSQRSMLLSLGVQTDPEQLGSAVLSSDAKKLVSNWVSTGFFGFLRGFAIDIWQLWVFLICFYVTITILGRVILLCIRFYGRRWGNLERETTQGGTSSPQSIALSTITAPTLDQSAPRNQQEQTQFSGPLRTNTTVMKQTPKLQHSNSELEAGTAAPGNLVPPTPPYLTPHKAQSHTLRRPRGPPPRLPQERHRRARSVSAVYEDYMLPRNLSVAKSSQRFSFLA